MKNTYREYNNLKYTFQYPDGTRSERKGSICFGGTYSSMLYDLKKCESVTFYWHNTMKMLGYQDAAEEFVRILQARFANVKGAMYDFVIDFNPTNLPEGLESHLYDNCFTCTVVPKNTGNITWYYLGCIIRGMANHPRAIINFIRIKDMKFGKSTILRHFGFHKTLMLATILRMAESEPDFIDPPSETFYPPYMDTLYTDAKLSVYLQKNLPMLKATNYRTNTEGNDITFDMMYNKLSRTWLIKRDVESRVISQGIYWTEGMDEGIINKLFVKRP